jgi:hypothetical protein
MNNQSTSVQDPNDKSISSNEDVFEQQMEVNVDLAHDDETQREEG